MLKSWGGEEPGYEVILSVHSWTVTGSFYMHCAHVVPNVYCLVENVSFCRLCAGSLVSWVLERGRTTLPTMVEALVPLYWTTCSVQGWRRTSQTVQATDCTITIVPTTRTQE